MGATAKERAMAGLYDGMEEAAFKRIDAGWVFQSRNPWLFGRSRYYLVDEAQKTAIAGCIRETLRKLKPVVIAAMFIIPLLNVGGVFLLVTLGRATPVNTVALMLVLFGPYVALTHVFSIRKLRPLLTDLPRTGERITLREGTVNFVEHMSFKLLLLLLCSAGMCAIGCLMMLADAFFEGHFRPQPAYSLARNDPVRIDGNLSGQGDDRSGKAEGKMRAGSAEDLRPSAAAAE
jgi:hypothetical protein